ncbi:MAG TPA: hypothetical protein VLF88_00750 [Candidatus Babeliales bacterium]|nr:hypothetical protein [Candidatus Babeliales bacterium]
MSSVESGGALPMDEDLLGFLDGIEDPTTQKEDQRQDIEDLREMRELWDGGNAGSVLRKFDDGSVLSGMAQMQMYRIRKDPFVDFTVADFLGTGDSDAAA